MPESVKIRSIGVIRTPFKEAEGCPIQPRFSDAEGVIEVLPEFRAGLRGIGQFSHVILVYRFHRSQSEKRRQRGIFTIRSPHRPNHIGISAVRLLSHRNGRLRVRHVDMLDGTPLLDIKPYVPGFDVRDGASSGWLGKHLAGGSAAKT